MLDLSFVRANLPLVEEKLRSRNADPSALLGDFAALDANRRARITELEQLQAQRNKLSEEVARLRKAGQSADAVVDQTRALKERSETLDAAAAEAEREMRLILASLPNLPADSVPVGAGEHDNVEIKRWGTPPDLPFTPRAHWELGDLLGILDLERAAKLSGARFAVYWGEGARLERALGQFMLDMQTGEHGYTEVAPPQMVNSRSLFGTGQLPKFAEDLFRTADSEGYASGRAGNQAGNQAGIQAGSTLRDNDHWLIPTAEVPLINLFRDEVVHADQLPISLTALTACFRSEAGAYGKDTRGIIRQHQFNKVELVKFAAPEHSDAEHERMTANAEAVLERLELPYRRVLLCTGDMGFSAGKTYDLEVWLPGQGLYREISSCSNCGDFQARRANIRYRPAGRQKPEHLHTLNGSGLAVGRTWVAVLENYQQADGTIRIPDALRPYMGGVEVISSRKEKH